MWRARVLSTSLVSMFGMLGVVAVGAGCCGGGESSGRVGLSYPWPGG